MSTKKNPSKYDCLDKLSDNEPYFVLRAQDVFAAHLVDSWCDLAEQMGGAIKNTHKIFEARSLAKEMRNWYPRKLPD